VHLSQAIVLAAGAALALSTTAAWSAPESAAGGASTPASVPAPETRSAQPLNNPASWVTTQDYPSEALREQAQGTVGFRLSISPSGTVTDCVITASSGSPVLDLTTCQLVRLRALFRPALADGKPVAGVYSNRVRWVVPRVRKPEAGELVISFLVGPDGTRSDCRVEKVVGEASQNAVAQRNPCQPGSFGSGYVDQAGRPVTRRVRTTLKVEVLPVP